MRRRSFLGAAALLPLGLDARAAPARYTVQLIVGGPGLAGVEIVLADGWKTYWRMPGEAGVPPEFDWSGSGNLLAAAVSYPAPHRYSDGSGETVGYSGSVIFPVAATARDPGQPVSLALELFFAVCNDVCIPARASLIPAPDRPDARQRIARSLALVPQPGDAVLAAKAEARDGAVALRVTLALDAPDDLDIFVEGGGLAYFHRPIAIGPRERLLPVAGLAEVETLRGRDLVMTLVGTGLRLEQTVRAG